MCVMRRLLKVSSVTAVLVDTVAVRAARPLLCHTRSSLPRSAKTRPRGNLRVSSRPDGLPRHSGARAAVRLPHRVPLLVRDLYHHYRHREQQYEHYKRRASTTASRLVYFPRRAGRARHGGAAVIGVRHHSGRVTGSCGEAGGVRRARRLVVRGVGLQEVAVGRPTRDGTLGGGFGAPPRVAARCGGRDFRCEGGGAGRVKERAGRWLCVWTGGFRGWISGGD